MISEVVTATNESIKLGVADSQVASVRSQVEEETAVRVYDGGFAGVASAVGRPDLDALTARARSCLDFQIAYPAQPSQGRQLSASHQGRWRSVDALVEMTREVLQSLQDAFPGFVLGHGVTQEKVGWQITNDLGLDLAYERVSTQAVFTVKEKGSGSIFDTFVATEGLDLSASDIIERFSAHLRAYSQPIGAAPTGRQRILFPGIQGMAGDPLVKLIQSDMVARAFGTGASVFKDKQGAQVFSEKLHLVDSRDSDAWRVSPFDMEGVVRDELDHVLIQAGQIGQPVCNKRDAVRYQLQPTGSGLGSLAQLPVTGVGKLVFAPTTPTLVSLLDGEPALMPWLVAGGDCTRAGDLGMPAQVLLRVEPDGTVSGRYDGGTLSGSIYEALGEGLVGISAQTVDPDSEAPYLLTHMDVAP